MSTCCSKARQDGARTSPDLLVIGAGSAGFSAAITAADAGANVVMVGQGTIGGTCVNFGCVPSKNLIRATGAVYSAGRIDRFDGTRGASEILDWAALVRQKQKLVEELRKTKYEDLLPAYPGISYITGPARFTGNQTEVDANGVSYFPGKIIIATGTSPVVPSINGIHSVPLLDSTSALELERLPRSLLVVGGGVIGCELGQMFNRAGVEVTICCRSRLLPRSEPELGNMLVDILRSEGTEVHQKIRYRHVERDGDGVRLVCQTENRDRIMKADRILVAAGRSPNTKTLSLEKAGIALSREGGIQVDAFMQTTHPDVYAVGDVTGRNMFVYMAAYGGKIAAHNALAGNTTRYDNTAMPEVVFTDPQYSAVGLTEAHARAKGLPVKTSVVSLENIPRFIVSHDTRGLIKLVAHGETGELLGASVLAPEAGDSIQTMVMALKAGMTAGELGETIFPYLTAVEGLKLAAQSFDKDVSKLSCCAG